MNADKIPDIIIGRLPVYLRALQRLADKGVHNTSSQELGEMIGISAALTIWRVRQARDGLFHPVSRRSLTRYSQSGSRLGCCNCRHG
jgi:hypothetical protein